MDASELERVVRGWAEQGLITAEQAEAIVASEAARPTVGAAAAPAAPPVAPGSPATKVPVIVEVLGYAGGTIALGALLALVGQFWDLLGTVGRIGLSWTAAIACLAGGWFIARNKIPAARRLGSFLLFIGTIAFGFAVGVLMFLYGPKGGDQWSWVQSVGAGTTTILAAVAWWYNRWTLQNVAIGVAAAWTIIAVASFSKADDPSGLGWPLMAFGLIWAGLAYAELLTPPNATWSMSALSLLGGAQVLSFSFSSSGHSLTRWLGLGIGLALAIGMIAASIPLRRGVLLGFGAAGVVVFMPQLLYEMFGSSVGVPIVLLLAGILLVAMAVVVIVVMPKMRADNVPAVSSEG